MNPVIPALASFIFEAISTWYPVSNHDFARMRGVSVVEQREFTTERYHDIAQDIATVATESEWDPFPEDREGERTTLALIIASFARYESGGFAIAADQATASGDHGGAWCLMQLHKPHAIPIVDRPSCFRAAIVKFRESFEMCKTSSNSWADGFTGYTTGRCQHDETHAMLRVKTAFDWYFSHPILHVHVPEVFASH